MSKLANTLGPLIGRSVQILLDPFSALVPGWAAAAQRCGLCRNSRHYVSPERLSRGLVVVLPGIEGPSLYTMGLRAGLNGIGGGEAGVAWAFSPAHVRAGETPVPPPGPAAVRVHNWAGFWPGGINAFSRRLADARADRLIRFVRDYRRDYPGRPVVLVGHSGGAAIAIFAAERLGPAEPLTGVIALATPLSPGYDLTAALAGVANPLVTCWSPLDYQLRLLVNVGRNFDGSRGRTAGQAGFAPPGSDSYGGRLRQIAWDRSMIADGHWGGHIGWAAVPWVWRNLAPLVAQWLR